jgi:hypothetical protein
MLKWNLHTVPVAVTYSYQSVLLLAVDGCRQSFGEEVLAEWVVLTVTTSAAPTVNPWIFCIEKSAGVPFR